MKKDWIILLSVFGSLIIMVVLVNFFKSADKTPNTVWIEKESGDGPYRIKGGSRSAEEAAIKKYEQLDSEITIKKTTSSHAVRYTSGNVDVNDSIFNQSETIPKVKF